MNNPVSSNLYDFSPFLQKSKWRQFLHNVPHVKSWMRMKLFTFY